MKKLISSIALAFVGMFVINAASAQTSTFNVSYGTGFAAKGDIQTVLGLNNAGFQNTAMNFTYDATVVSEVTWECTNDNNEHVQQRQQTTTSSVTGLVSSLARVRNQVTGYYLTGFNGSTTSSSTTDGPAVNSCPATPSTFYLSSPAGDPVVVSSTGGLFVNGVSLPTL